MLKKWCIPFATSLSEKSAFAPVQLRVGQYATSMWHDRHDSHRVSLKRWRKDPSVLATRRAFRNASSSWRECLDTVIKLKFYTFLSFKRKKPKPQAVFGFFVWLYKRVLLVFVVFYFFKVSVYDTVVFFISVLCAFKAFSATLLCLCSSCSLLVYFHY